MKLVCGWGRGRKQERGSLQWNISLQIKVDFVEPSCVKKPMVSHRFTKYYPKISSTRFEGIVPGHVLYSCYKKGASRTTCTPTSFSLSLVFLPCFHVHPIYPRFSLKRHRRRRRRSRCQLSLMRYDHSSLFSLSLYAYTIPLGHVHIKSAQFLDF